MLGISDACRISGQGLLDRGCTEEHLNELPVALVLVVPVVVVPVEPVLHGEEAGTIRLLRDVGVHSGLSE